MTEPSAQAPLRLRWSGQTDRGRVRRNNEDSFLGLQFDARETHHLGKIGEASLANQDCVFAVSDGIGGERAGEFASRIAVEKIVRLLPPAFKHSAAGMDAGHDDILTELFHEIHRALNYLGWGDPDCAGMGATLSLCWFRPEWMHFAHIGDSRIYHLPAAGGIRQLSHDDTYTGWLHRQGKLTEPEARRHPARTSLQKALGAGHQFVDPQLGAVGCVVGDAFLLCSDGVVDGLFDAEICRLLREPSPAEREAVPARRLVEAAVAQSGRDNTTAFFVEVE